MGPGPPNLYLKRKPPDTSTMRLRTKRSESTIHTEDIVHESDLDIPRKGPNAKKLSKGSAKRDTENQWPLPPVPEVRKRSRGMPLCSQYLISVEI